MSIVPPCFRRGSLVLALVSACGDAEDTGDGGSGGTSTGTASATGDSASTQPSSEDAASMTDASVDGSSGSGGGSGSASVDSSGSSPTSGSDGGSSEASGSESVGDCPGGCEAPFTCAPAGYCASETGIPQFDRVYVVIFENRSLESVMGHAPYLDSLAAMGAYATEFDSITHPSLPNYIAMTSGDTWGIACDCHPGTEATCDAFSCNLILSSCECPNDVEHLGDQLDSVGVTWREYGEGMGTPCNGTDDAGNHYAAKHLPFLYYTNVFTDDVRCEEHVRDYGDFAADLAAGSYRFTMISPDLCNDMHDTCGGDPVTHGDDWASTNIAPILETPGFAADGRDALFIVFDEQDNSVGHAPIPFIVVSPLIDAGTVTAGAYDHYSLLATWEDGYGVPRLGHATEATPISDIWK